MNMNEIPFGSISGTMKSPLAKRRMFRRDFLDRRRILSILVAKILAIISQRVISTRVSILFSEYLKRPRWKVARDRLLLLLSFIAVGNCVSPLHSRDKTGNSASFVTQERERGGMRLLWRFLSP
jgi:hypothetical protein